jgi:16S rRNA (uracil1498-N3)-methyltransferase
VHRFIVKPSDIKNNLVELNEKESHHALRVLRLQVGDAVQVLDGKGQIYSGFISGTDNACVQISLDPNQAQHLNSAVKLTLACSIIKADRMEWLIEKACELGVFEIIPLVTERSIVRLDEKARISKQKRWQKIIEASCKQCGLAHIPQIRSPKKWKDFLADCSVYDLKLIPNLAIPSQPLPEALEQNKAARSIVVAIGPEGDFTETEVRQAASADFKGVQLGSLVMRSETAALYSLSSLQFYYGAKA